MGKKGAHSGQSPKDRSINLMDKFITRSEKRNQFKEKLPARRKDASVPLNLWPLKDQIEYWESKTISDQFDEMFPSYGHWYSAVQKKSGVYHSTFMDFTRPHKEHLMELYNKKTQITDAVYALQKLGIY
jgi:hypothetical protein